MKGRRRKYLAGTLIIVLFIVLAIFFTRPVLWKGHNATVKDPHDSTFNAWTLARDLHVLASNPFDLYDANIFFPNTNTLAYSESQVATAILSIPFMATTENPVQSSNYMLIFHFFLCSIGAYFLAMHLTGNRLASVVAGIVFAYAPFKLAHVMHLPLCAAGWMPLSLLFLHRYCEEKRSSDAVIFALFFILQVLSTWYYGLILGIAVIVFLAVRLVVSRRTFTLKWTLVLALSIALAIGAIMPFAIPYFQVHRDDPRLVREVEEVDLFSADVQDFLVAPPENMIWGNITSGLRENTEERGGPPERSLFPGFLPLLFGIGGAWYLFKRRKAGTEKRFRLWYYVALPVISVVLCLGTSLYVFGDRLDLPMPYELLYHFVPGFKALRVPPRFFILVVLALAILSAFAVKGLVSWVSSRRGQATVVVVSILLVALLMVDLMSVYMPMHKVPLKEEFPPVYSWLSEQEAEAPTVELPVADYDPGTFNAGLQYEESWLGLERERTYYSILHWKKLLNGYSGFIPSTYYEVVRACRDFPSDECMDLFRELGIEYLLVHGDELGPEKLAAMIEWDSDHEDIELAVAFDPDYVYRLR